MIRMCPFGWDQDHVVLWHNNFRLQIVRQRQRQQLSTAFVNLAFGQLILVFSAAYETTDRPAPPTTNESQSSKAQCSNVSDLVITQSFTPNSKGTNMIPTKVSCTPDNILPVPSCSDLRLKKKTRKHGKTAVLNESPNKNQLQMDTDLKTHKEVQSKDNAKKTLERVLLQL